MRKKAVFLPYDFDTALGTNNEGDLVFGYNLEDTDHTQSGADVFNGQDSVLWNNLRKTFPKELQAMYQSLRSSGALSYEKVERMFEAHQGKWGEAVFNEDSNFKYIAPLADGGDGTYIPMLQGTKEAQRKWRVLNRFRYIDSKYNAGEALTSYVQLRGYAKSNITITPYADIYVTVKFGSYVVSQRAVRNQPCTIVCPVDTLNDTEIYVYSANQIASLGDLSGFKAGLADFSSAIKAQDVKLGDSDPNYSNGNLKSLYLGNNTLLRTLDVRNCVALGTDDKGTKAPDISGCTNIEYVYFDGTSITGLTLPNGGILKALHLPATVANLTILNQTSISDFTMPSYANIQTLWLDNVSSAVNSKAILNAIPAASRVRLIGFYWEAANAAEILALFDKLDTMRGLDEHGYNVDVAQVSGTIHTSTLSAEENEAIGQRKSRYPYLTIAADHSSAILTLKTWDGGSTVGTVTFVDGVAQSSIPTPPSRTQTDQYTFSAVGWATTTDASTATSGCTENVTTNRTVYAAYSRTLRRYTITFANSDGATLQSSMWDYGARPSYSGSTPVDPTGEARQFLGFTPAITTVTGNKTYTASYKASGTVWINPSFDVTGAYAAQWDYSIDATVLARGGAAASFNDPSPATTNAGSGSSPFDNIQPWAGMKRFNVVNGTLIPDTSASYDETANDTVVYIPEFYYKCEKDTDNTRWTWAISPTAKSGYTKHPGSGRYIGRFHTTGSSAEVGTKSGVAPLTNVTRGTFRIYSHNKGTNWWQLDLATWSALQMLYIVEFANWYSQDVLGKGQNSGSVKNTGSTTGAAYHTIKRAGAEGNMYRWVENPFSNVLTWVDGFVASERAAYVSTDNATFSDTTTNMTQTEITLPNSNYVTGLGYSQECPWAFIPDTASSGSATKYLTDYVYSSAGVRVLRVGGDCVDYDSCGFFCFAAYGDASYRYSLIGSRLLYNP